MDDCSTTRWVYFPINLFISIQGHASTILNNSSHKKTYVGQFIYKYFFLQKTSTNILKTESGIH